MAMAHIDRGCAEYLSAIPDDQAASARNLLHDLALGSQGNGNGQDPRKRRPQFY
jgi:hypothetical protein